VENTENFCLFVFLENIQAVNFVNLKICKFSFFLKNSSFFSFYFPYH